jgi:hypothetical protein
MQNLVAKNLGCDPSQPLCHFPDVSQSDLVYHIGTVPTKKIELWRSFTTIRFFSEEKYKNNSKFDVF